MILKNNICEYTEREFYDVLQKTRSKGDDFDEELIYALVPFFSKKIQHPKGSDLLFYPVKCGIEDSSEAVIAELKRYYKEQGMRLFKDD